MNTEDLDISQIHLSLAGSGDPWSSLTKLRVWLLRELHNGVDLNELASRLDLTPEELSAEIQPLQDTSLVFSSNGQLRPSFLFANYEETQLVYKHASEFSKTIADSIEENFENIRESYMKLDVSNEYNFEEMAFLLIGGRIIDIKLLEKLTEGQRLMPPAPPRPGPERPDAHYYFWMIEGEKKHLGEYGLDDYDLPWQSWRYFSFGQNIMNGRPNIKRVEMKERCFELIESGTIKSPKDLSEKLSIPIVTHSDSKNFAKTSDRYASLLSLSYKEHEQSIKVLHKSLKSGEHAPHSYGEFFCWYAHIAYSVAIDILESKGILPVPATRFQSAIWYREQDQEGLLARP